MSRASIPLCVSLAAMLAAACSSTAPADKAQPAANKTAASVPAGMTHNALWGEMKPIVSVKELMHDMIDPASDFVFDSIAIETTKNGTIEHRPKTDDDWEKLRIGAVTMGEGVYLLKVPRPFAPAGDENNSTGPDPEELSPTQIAAKVQADPVQWNARIEALRNVSLEVLQIVQKKDVDQLWDASDNLDTACENCHVNYWYPNEGALFKRLDKKLNDLYGDQMKPMGSRAPVPSKGK